MLVLQIQKKKKRRRCLEASTYLYPIEKDWTCLARAHMLGSRVYRIPNDLADCASTRARDVCWVATLWMLC